MRFAAEDLLSALLEAAPRPTVQAPRDSRGLYGLVDHRGDLRYIGSTSSTDQTFYERIHQRHRTGSEGMSHYFSHMYNTGRMWRDRKDSLNKADGDIAKALRNEFVSDHCRAVWIQVPDTADIVRLEAEVLALAPDYAIAWNRRRMQPYDEPADLVEATLKRLGWGNQERAAVDRQRLRFITSTASTAETPKAATVPQRPVPPFPKGPFRFFALDVETANNDRGSICQIGVACVRHDNSIETWVTYVDPQVDQWVFTYLHGISARTVQGAPTFAEVLTVLRNALAGTVIYQHSGFDRSAVAAACGNNGLAIPHWDWRDSVQVARTAWPELRGNGGHGLANLKQHLGLVFDHHDAGEDARAAAEVVLHAEEIQSTRTQHPARPVPVARANDKTREIIVGTGSVAAVPKPAISAVLSDTISHGRTERHIGTTEITQGNINNNHIYLRAFFEKFPDDAIGGSNRESAASREIAVDWGGEAVVMTDLDGAKKFFRKRGWIREFFEQRGVRAGDIVTVEEIAPYSYRISHQRRSWR
ncbi:DNA polymerase III subunit epsilon [Pannonibacter phragmitetus]|uniref:DNA polymerase III subunit epsilon n=1 Tax=Pannonibacter phragmitetus TaxID=121719 RepID=A0A378ZWM4_9HYPH|nr:3'-5' exonuclease [Pannonibacter phragmitetus]SUB01468.1 DNA polymerase III subunit epsilon [Pannonibacter phragmitetus]